MMLSGQGLLSVTPTVNVVDWCTMLTCDIYNLPKALSVLKRLRPFEGDVISIGAL